MKALYLENNENLIDYSIFNSIKHINHFSISKHDQQLDFSGFQNLESVLSISINENSELTNLNGLENLCNVQNRIEIHNNINLTDFCGLKKVLENSFSGTLDVIGNAENPNGADLIEDCN